MTMIYIVTLTRFIDEYKNHVLTNSLKHVNWMVDEHGIIHMYIDAHGSNETYYCSSPAVDVGPEIQNMLSKKGEILGIESAKVYDMSEPSSYDINEVKRVVYNIQNKVISDDS